MDSFHLIIKKIEHQQTRAIILEIAKIQLLSETVSEYDKIFYNAIIFGLLETATFYNE